MTRKNSGPRLAAAVILALGTALTPLAAHAATLAVPGDYADLAAALGAARTGDTVTLSGSFSGPLAIDVAGVTVDASATTISLNGTGAAIKVQAGGVTLKGGTITCNDRTTDNYGVSVEGKLTDVTVSGVSVADCRVGVGANDSPVNLSVTGSTFTGGTSPAAGAARAGIWVIGAGGATDLSGNTFTGYDAADIDSAVQVASSTGVTLKDNTFTGNTTAITLTDSHTITIANTVVTGNKESAIFIAGGSGNVTIKNLRGDGAMSGVRISSAYGGPVGDVTITNSNLSGFKPGVKALAGDLDGKVTISGTTFAIGNSILGDPTNEKQIVVTDTLACPTTDAAQHRYFTESCTATAAPVTFVQATCSGSTLVPGTYTVPTVDGVVYRIGSTQIGAGSHSVSSSSTVTVSAVAAAGVTLDNPGASWSFPFTIPTCSTPTASPTQTPTATPTEGPTGTPTGEPTQTATTEPTAEPTGSQTSEPTQSSTAQPTAGGSTGEPTASGTCEPTGSATAGPSSEPSATATEIDAGPTSSQGVSPTSDESLPLTGSNILPVVVIAVVLLAAGGAAVWFRRRTRGQ